MPALLALDLDGVIAKVRSSWEYMHRYFGSSQKEVYRTYSRLYMQGRISYQEWMKADIEHLLRASGSEIRRQDLVDAFSRVEIYEHAEEVVRIARKAGAKVAIVSSGVEVLARLVAKRLGVRICLSNILIFDEEERLIPGGLPLVEPLRKDRVLRRISSALGTSLRDTIFVGDSVWDLSALSASGAPVLLSHSREEEASILREWAAGEDPGRILVARSGSELLEVLREILYRGLRGRAYI